MSASLKKALACLLCLLTVLAFAACTRNIDAQPTADDPSSATESTQPSQSDDPTEPDDEQPDRSVINYKGLKTADFTTEDMAAAEGRAEDFSTEQDGVTIYVYNNVSLEELFFTQVQYTFNEKNNRISCTYSADERLDEVAEEIRTAVTSWYGEPSMGSDGTTAVWRDGSTENYVMLTQLNDTTVQLVFYLCEGAQ